jgi:SNF2 family DNA or RNA helicase
MDYKFRTKPYKHQEDIFNKIKDMPNYALLMEQGTGKTKVIIDNFSYLYKKGNIDAVLVVAPNGVHRNWINDEVPKHMPEDIKYKSMFWDNSKSKTKKFQERFLDLLNDNELCILTCNVESFRVPKAVFNFLTYCKRKNVMMVVDESARIKNPKAKQTREIIKLGNFATYKRILTGTPVTNSPFDVYSQFEFLDKSIIDHNSFYSFKNYYGVFEKKTNWGSNRQYDELKSYRNLEELKALLDPFSYRITKAECLDLPEKIHTKRYFKLSTKQRDVYETIKEEFILEIDKSQIPLPMALTRLMKLQQVTSNFVILENDKTKFVDEENHPRLDATMEIINDIPEDQSIIIWCRFRHDIKIICDALDKNKITNVRYDGDTKADTRQKNLIKFQSKQARVFVANPATASEGLNLFVANNVIYYSNSFKYGERQQSEDRAHRIGQKNNVLYFDLIAENTLDNKIIKVLLEKQELANIITGDNIKEWL